MAVTESKFIGPGPHPAKLPLPVPFPFTVRFILHLLPVDFCSGIHSEVYVCEAGTSQETPGLNTSAPAGVLIKRKSIAGFVWTNTLPGLLTTRHGTLRSNTSRRPCPPIPPTPHLFAPGSGIITWKGCIRPWDIAVPMHYAMGWHVQL